MSNKQETSGVQNGSGGVCRASIGAVVTAVPKGKKAFAVAYPLPESVTEHLTKDTSVTFALCDWTEGEHNPPGFGQVVELKRIKRFARGWRATSASPVAI